MFKFIFISFFFAVVQAVDFQITNQLGGVIYVGIQGNSGKPHLENGGFRLDYGATVRNLIFVVDNCAIYPVISKDFFKLTLNSLPCLLAYFRNQ